MVPQFPCARKELGSWPPACWVAGVGLCWSGAGGRQCRCLPNLVELLVLGLGEGMAARELQGTNPIGRFPPKDGLS